MSDRIFSFGTLQLADVQRSLFGRTVEGDADELAGYILSELLITDPDVIATSGTDRHPALVPGSPQDIVHGVALLIDPAELEAADRYEQASYRRIAVVLRSGRAAWVYVPKTE